MADFVANFDLENNEIESDFDLEQTQFDAILELNPAGASWGGITGNIENQTDLQEQLATKADVSTVEELANDVTNIANTIDTYGDIVTYNASNFATSEQGTLADTALQPNDDISKLVNDVGYITDSALSDYATTTDLTNGLAEKQDTISDLDTIRSNAENGQSAYTTIQSYGDIVTYNASDFATSVQGGLADTALQPNDNISELNNDAGYITSSSIPTNYVTTDTTQSVTGTKNFTQINNVNNNNLATYNSIQLTNDIGNTSENLRLQGNGDRPKYRSGSNTTSFLALQSDIQTYTAGAGIDITSNAISVTSPVIIDNATGTHSIAVGSSSQSTAEGSVAIGDTAKANSTYSIAIGYNAQATNTNSVVIGKQAKATAARTVAIGSGAEANANDALVIKGINNTANSFQVGSYTLLDTSTGLIPDARINSSTYATQSYVNNAVQTNSAHFRGNWADWSTVPTNVNDYPADDDGNKTPTVNDYMVVQDASDYTLDTLEGTWQFTYTGAWADNGKAGWLPRFQVNETPLTQTQLDALNSGANATNIGQIATNTNDISNINTTIGGYGDVVTYNASDFATASQGSKADTALQSGDNISELNNNSGYITGITSLDVTNALGYTPYNSTNPNGYTTNVGTVTSVNNNQPDANGNVALTIPTVNDGILTITQNGTSKGTFSANQSINDTIALTDTTYNTFTGADGTNAGSSGLVPAPSATDNDKYLKGDGTWASVSSGSSTDVQINGTSITSGGVANIVTNTAYNASSNKIATMSDVPSISGLANTDLSNLTATGEAHFLKNTASGLYSLGVLGSTSTAQQATSIGSGASATYNGNIAIGSNAISEMQNTIVIGTGLASLPNYFHIKSYPVFDMSTGKISDNCISGSKVIDGQWIGKYKSVSTATSTGSRTHDLSSYLPSDNYKYEVWCVIGIAYNSSAGGLTVGTMANPDNNKTTDGNFYINGYVPTNSRYQYVQGSIPIGTDKKMYSQVTGATLAAANIVLCGYRRIGTNS